ncbi:hypothetical protein DAEQUDRAFT_257101 [Daedalea quercina L-15889]|uniref:Uncharacterized protein n=1 Tax=Daedalea quercina L-15889 TaxID=1314783 RepID=A0A165QJ87_9APHY|nr:hypothetical protein DAEQUDRAFT_257101 [Daedalea quercina L-15889]
MYLKRNNIATTLAQATKYGRDWLYQPTQNRPLESTVNELNSLANRLKHFAVHPLRRRSWPAASLSSVLIRVPLRVARARKLHSLLVVRFRQAHMNQTPGNGYRQARPPAYSRAYPSARRPGSIIPCRWTTPEGLCNTHIVRTQEDIDNHIHAHLSYCHRRDEVDCRWGHCNRRVEAGSMPNHVKSAHLQMQVRR